MRVLLRGLRFTVCAASALWLTACGGGGVGGTTQTETLYVSFSYVRAETNLRAPLKAAPSIDGLKGHAPHCAVAGGALPAGVTLDPVTCVIAGTPATAGRYGVDVRLTSADVQGSVDAHLDLIVSDPTPALVRSALPVDAFAADFVVQYAKPAATGPVVALDGGYVAQGGDSIRYALVGGALPSGMALDSATAAVRGTPTGFGTTSAQIAVTLVRGGIAYTSTPFSFTMRSVALAIRFGYPNSCIVPVGTTLTCTPTLEDPAAFAGVTFRYSSLDLPAGFSIDASTGVVTGATTVASDLRATVTLRATFPDGSVDSSSGGVLLRMAGVFPMYDLAPGDYYGIEPIYFLPPGYSAGARFTPGGLFGVNGVRVTGPVAGDAYAYALLPFDASTPLPSWLHADPATGRLFGTPPSDSAAPISWRVQLTTRRGGTTYVNSTAWLATFQ